MAAKENKQFKRTYILAVSICLGFLIASTVFVYNMMAQSEENSMESIYAVVNQNKTSLTTQIKGDFQTLRAIATCLDVTELSGEAEIGEVLKNINDNNAFIRMGIADTSGNLTLLDVDGRVHENVDVSFRAFFREGMSGRESISDTIKDSFTQDNYINYYGVPLTDDRGEIVGVLCAVQSTDIFWEILEQPVLGGSGFSNLINSEGSFIIRSSQLGAAVTKIEELGAFGNVTLKEADAGLQRGKSGQFTYKSGGVEYHAVFEPAGINNWYILSVVPEDVIRQHYSRMALGVSVIIVAACVIFMFLLIRQSRIMKKSEQALTKLAYRDSLTGCRNYPRFLMEAEAYLERMPDRKIAIWYCDIKRFKYFNDIFGYNLGDQVLIQIARLFERNETPDSLFCRINADHFAGMRPYERREEVKERFDSFAHNLVNQDLETAGFQYIELCMGCYCTEEPTERLSVNEMINRANMVKNSLKSSGGNQFAFFSDELRRKMRREAELEAMQKTALENGEFMPYMQPKINIQRGDTIAGAEVLCRWKNPQNGLISPAEFIPLFEQNGFIVSLDRYMFEQACVWLRRHLDGGGRPLILAVNVSRLGLMQEDFLEYYKGLKEQYGIGDNVLELEFTESLMMDDNEMFRETVSELQRNGFFCSMDDFGSGYSSLNVLKNLPIEVLKLDILFFHDALDERRGQVVVANVVNMARDLNMRTIAEGVETEEQVAFLREVGCDLVQGYVFAKPMPHQEFEELLKKTGGGPLLPEAQRV